MQIFLFKIKGWASDKYLLILCREYKNASGAKDQSDNS